MRVGLVWIVARGELRGELVALKTKVLEKKSSNEYCMHKARQQLVVTASAGGGI